MLIDLIAHIERALVSYIKMVEARSSNLVLDQGMESLLSSSTGLSDTRRNDIAWIYNTCCIALDEHWSVSRCIEEVYNYLMRINTGFLFFPGNSKLRSCLFQAIEQYDIRYLSWVNGKAEFCRDVSTVRAIDTLKASSREASCTDNPISSSEILQNKIERLEIHVSSMREIINQHDSTVSSFVDLLSEFKDTLRQTRSELADSKIENMRLREMQISMIKEARHHSGDQQDGFEPEPSEYHDETDRLKLRFGSAK